MSNTPSASTDYILDPLNETQREAVSAPPGHTLVLAGAGSGKTRVLVHRIAWLVETGAVMPNGILAVTFTNKAATQMRARIEAMLNRSLGVMWVGTFHGLAHRMLRLHWRDTDLPEGFQILDSEDQLRMIRRVIGNMELDDSQWQPKSAQGFINAQKDEGLRARHVEDRNDFWRGQMCAIYQNYEESCQRSGLVDFAELLLKAHELLRERDDLLLHYQRRFSHLLVDEFQDTNTIQYAWIRLMAGTTGQVFMVGDDDQSIYGWRGAKIENIHRFSDDFPQVRTFRLERNYRSTGNILAAANALIARNQGRLGKNLWTSGSDGEPVQLYEAFNEQEEGEFVVDRIGRWIADGGRRDQVAVLYRVSAQSRVFEERLLRGNIPYRVHGGLRFYERAEIKDALAYLRLMMNRHDDAAFERVVNQPPRGIGARTMEAVRVKSRAEGLSLWSAARSSIDQGEFATRAAGAMGNFLRLIDALAADPVGDPGADADTADPAGDPVNDPAGGAPSREDSLYEIVDGALKKSGLLHHYQTDKSDRARTRVENLEELVSAVSQFERELAGYQPEEPGQGAVMAPLAAFLSHAALEAGESQDEEDAVHLMTLHAAKGLEFPVVFLCGLEERLFPHQLSAESDKKIEEERRLCYVGMTRAEQLLYLSYAENRRLHGADYQQLPSRFIAEIPEEHLHRVRVSGAGAGDEPRKSSPKSTRKSPKKPPPNNSKTNQFQRPAPKQPPAPKKATAPVRKRRMGLGGTKPQWSPGQSVVHPKFGEGVVLSYEGDGEHARVEVDFSEVGAKWLVVAYARLEAK
uniref:DNA 3'-5' helicase n=1 Tax=Candidatus Kentrum sp. FM TaxID=2126340 RepID=A0A450TJV7_9GAMM|nr:MAG: DNA helicase-2 / ATP-dependent DNA helicase PcrA [Candidatus Kentron sp. FM]VFJ70458.1 MAG: DNA helicase-2 / ATP-dependent DNA helicase PcrA [Candidatus Kentron sp. FM]VFK09159.1 MAG: DNA helicase-2 / ATP-dependent DNA helicase PcrA [Candidatus Kentron sp. FM]